MPKPERLKLDLKARKCILLGYSEHQKGYRLYDLGREKVFSSRDVVFNEASEKEQKGSGEKYVELEIEEPVAEDPAAPELDAVDPEPEIEEPVVEDAVIPNPTARDEADEMGDQIAEERRSEELQRKVSTTSDPPVRRSTRIRRERDWHGFVATVDDPSSVSEALSSHDKSKWEEAMERDGISPQQ